MIGNLLFAALTESAIERFTPAQYQSALSEKNLAVYLQISVS